MGIYRPDGSVESSALGSQKAKYWGIYRAQLTDIFYIDDTKNNSSGSGNPEILYNAIIVGGSMSGFRITNVRNGMRIAGSEYNFSETTLQPNLKGDVSNIGGTGFTPSNQQSGDMVFVAFQDGDPMFPLILGFAANGLNAGGTAAADGPQSISEYNGVEELIDNKGNYSVTVKTGSMVNGQFVPADSMSSELELKMGEVMLKEVGTAELHLKSGKVALGANGTELFDELTQALGDIIDFLNNTDSTHTHLGNLGYPTGAPLNASGFTSLASSLSTIKSALEAIKGTL